MNNKKLLRITALYTFGALLVTAVWIAALYTLILPKAFYKTQATVIDINAQSPFSYSGARQVNNFPSYSYIDDKGQSRIFYSRDGFNGFNSFLFKKEVGKTYAAYYEKGSKEGLWITATGNWLTFLLAPLIFAIFPLGALFAAVILLRAKKK